MLHSQVVELRAKYLVVSGGNWMNLLVKGEVGLKYFFVEGNWLIYHLKYLVFLIRKTFFLAFSAVNTHWNVFVIELVGRFEVIEVSANYHEEVGAYFLGFSERKYCGVVGN